MKIEGTVVKTETRETAWGMREVMVVKSNEGWVCWCSVPSGVKVEKDCKIVFVALHDQRRESSVEAEALIMSCYAEMENTNEECRECEENENKSRNS